MELYYIINYYIKYVELIDTVLLALKKKPLGMSSSSVDPNLLSHYCASVPSRLPSRRYGPAVL